jgi:magnesium transporter
MNFKYMPELDSPYGYPMLWIFMVVSSVVMVVYMKHKKWL